MSHSPKWEWFVGDQWLCLKKIHGSKSAKYKVHTDTKCTLITKKTNKITTLSTVCWGESTKYKVL